MTISDNNEQNEQKIFICKLCVFKMCKKNNYNRHILTLKHKNLSNSDTIVTHEFYKKGLNLPSYMGLSDLDIEYICNTIKGVIIQ